MKDIRVILLAAGQGSRMQNVLHGRPKPLVTYGDEPLLHRTIRQLNEIGFTDVTVVTGYRREDVASSIRSYFPSTRTVHNPYFHEDRNIYSLMCGFGDSDAPTLIIEGDVAFSDKSILHLRKGAFLGKSFWASCGHFKPHQYGGIIKATESGDITEILYAKYAQIYRDYYKNLGAIFCGAHEMPRFRALLAAYAAQTLDHYFMTPWAEHLAELPAVLIDLGEDGGASFNTAEEYHRALRLVPPTHAATAPCRDIELEAVDRLRHIEGFDRQRATWLAEKIRTEGVWTAPLIIDREHCLVMDGQHRMEAAALLGLRQVPVVRFSYVEVDVWSLRPETEEVTADEIIRRGLGGSPYPYKTAKHRFPEQIPSCSYTLKDLR